MLDSYIPAVEKMRTQLKKYSTAFTSTKAENEKLKKKNKKLSELDEATHESVLKQLKVPSSSVSIRRLSQFWSGFRRKS